MSTTTNLRLDDQLCFALYAATNAVTRAYRPLLESIGLTYPQYILMLVLWERDEQPVHAVATRLDLAAHALSPILARLEQHGLITRRRDDHDRRVTIVSLTQKGADLEQAASTAQLDVVDQTRLCGEELHGLRDDLRALAFKMTGLAPGTPTPAGAETTDESPS